ncbi:uncharacterized protein LOC143919681 [Arctopsyche grandis]|uniref:uncharacterized protein LOC143919681 n=1 Tax=Arctopsyche grandis TaxID=121162 RepID=UPI00406D6855
MECRLCLCSAPAGSFVSIHDDLHPRRLVQHIWACCQLRVRKGDKLPDIICLSCVNNLELLNSFRNACRRSAETSRVRSGECLKVEPEEVLLDDLIWKNESIANLPLNISGSPDEDETRGGKNISDDNMAEIINTIDIPAEELPLRKTNLTRHMKSHSGEKPFKCDICLKSFMIKFKLSLHMSVHSVVKPHKCEICLKAFFGRSNLTRHMKIHAREKQVKCNVCWTKVNHNCDSINTKSDIGLSIEIKSDIDDLYKKKFKLKAIMDILTEKYANPPNIAKVKNYLSPLKRSIYGPSTLSLGDLEKWLKINGAIPSDDHKSFIINYMMDESEDGVFRFIASSKALLKLALRDNFIIHADATYKLIWQGFPVLVIGTSDRNKKFHILAVAVCSNEQTADFEFVFRSLKETVKKIYDFEMRIKVLIADASYSIKNGFENTFGTDAVIRMCWTHMRRAVYKKAQVLVEKIHVDKILADIDAIQISENQNTFIKAYELFRKKWENEPIFLKYFQREWYHKNRNWYEGACRGTPSTNNGLKSTSQIIKDEYTFRERLPLPRFCHLLMEMVEAFSKKYDNGQEFSINVLIDLKTWTSAYQWARLNKKIKTVCDGAKKIYLIPGGEYNEISQNLLEEREDNFDEYLKNKGSYYTLTLPIDNDKWEDGECTCPMFLKNYMCKHLLGIAIRLKFVRPPPEAKNLEIGMKRKRGRPSRTKKTLIVQ